MLPYAMDAIYISRILPVNLIIAVVCFLIVADRMRDRWIRFSLLSLLHLKREAHEYRLMRGNLLDLRTAETLETTTREVLSVCTHGECEGLMGVVRLFARRSWLTDRLHDAFCLVKNGGVKTVDGTDYLNALVSLYMRLCLLNSALLFIPALVYMETMHVLHRTVMRGSVIGKLTHIAAETTHRRSVHGETDDKLPTLPGNRETAGGNVQEMRRNGSHTRGR